MTVDFKKMMVNAGLPVDEDAAKQQWENELTKQDITVQNNSPFSPFWRTIKGLITKPVVSLLDFVAKSLMPDLFIMTASREALINLHGPSRNVFILDAIKAKGVLKLTRTDSSGTLSVNLGTVVTSDELNGKRYQLKLVNSAVFKAGETTTYVLAEATTAGQGYNLAAGSYTKFADPAQSQSVSVTNESDWLSVPGADEESTEAYRNRIRDVFGTAASWHINTVYKNIISSFGIPVDNIEIKTGAPRGPGTANAYVYLTVGTVSTGLLATINQHIRDDGHHGHGDDFFVYAMPTQNVDVTATYTLHAHNEEIKNELETFIRAAFRENDAYQPTRPEQYELFSFSLLKTELHQQFPGLKTIKFNIDEIDCQLWLPRLNSLAVSNG